MERKTAEFADATLIIAAHGSTLNAESADPAYQHGDYFRREKTFAGVVEAFWKQEPGFPASLRAAWTPRVFIVPLFISEGYFTEEVLPREFGFSPGGAPFPKCEMRPWPIIRPEGAPEFQEVFYCGPVGTHSSMTEVLLARAREIMEKFPFPRAPKPRDTALIIAGHGTGNNENSRKAIEHQVELIRSRDVYAEVHSAFMEEDPRIGDIYKLTTVRNIIMVPFFISDGLHSFEDIPVMLGEAERIVQKRYKEGQPTWRNPTEKQGKLVWYTRSIGNEAHIPEVIIQRVREAAAIKLTGDYPLVAR